MSRAQRPGGRRVGRGGHTAGSYRGAAGSRVESGPATRLVGELPAGWVQAIVTSPTRSEVDGAPSWLFRELRRVLRADGTLWLLTAEKYLPAALSERGWIAQEIDWATPLRVDPAGRARLYLFVKGPEFFYSTRAVELFLAPRTRAALARREGAGGGRGCAWSPEHRRDLLRLCILAGTSRVACGVCGAPYTRTPKDAWCATCAHQDPRGRCLVLDPFCHPGTGAHEVAPRLGRVFLGITAGGGGSR
ncbi:MAG TPA: hypothetical protein VK756_02210 [Solirubrobacteraceae bacterium]|jgi:hypothetical protein|nr:hypothetical protein [Solirubrobacteraceae bacterium]